MGHAYVTECIIGTRLQMVNIFISGDVIQHLFTPFVNVCVIQSIYLCIVFSYCHWCWICSSRLLYKYVEKCVVILKRRVVVVMTSSCYDPQTSISI